MALGLVLLFVLLTAIPLPPALDFLAGPLRHQQNQDVIAAFAKASQAGVPAPTSDSWFALSRNRAGTLRYFLLLSAAFGAALLSASLTQRWKTTYLRFLVILGTTVGIAGWLGQWKIPQGDTIWWFIPIPHAPTSPVGCFLNRNHFGGFVAMLCPVALALASESASRKKWAGTAFYLIMLLVMTITVALSLSRGALLALGVGLIMSTLLIAFRHRAMLGIIVLVCLVAGAAILFSQTTAVRERFSGIHHPASLSSAQSRLAEWRESLRVWPHYPLIGCGMNALRMVYPQYRQTSVSARLIHAENEYVQLLVEGGVLGTSLILAVVLAARARRRESPSATPAVIAIAATGALTVTGVHCLIDFPAHLPLYALVLGSVAGLMLPPIERPLRWGRPLMAAPSQIGLLGALVLLTNHPDSLKTLDDPDFLFTARYRVLHQALVWAPTSSAWIYLGRAMYKEGATRGDYPLCAAGESFISHAAELDPQNYRLWYELGETRLALKQTAPATEAFQRAQHLRSWLSPPPIPRNP